MSNSNVTQGKNICTALLEIFENSKAVTNRSATVALVSHDNLCEYSQWT